MSHLDPAIKDYYDRAPEESRLEIGPFRLEKFRSREIILRHAPKPPAVVLDAEDLHKETSDAGFETVGLYGIEGPGWILPDIVDRWNDPARRELLRQVARSLESEHAVMGCSAHLLVVGRKPTAHRPWL